MQSKLTEFLSLSALAFALTACSGGGGSDSGSDIGTPDTGGGDQTGIRSATVDASSQSDYVYFNLTRGETVALTADEAAASQDWHLAFRRTNIKLNGGASGPGTVAGALLVAQDDFYDVDGDADANIFLNATPDSELEHLSGLLTPASRLVSDSISSALVGSGDMVGGQMDMGWYFYDLATHTLSLNDTTGTAGKLLNDPRLYDTLQRLVTRIDSIAADLQKNPRRYINLEIF